jgi:hypothetical protein
MQEYEFGGFKVTLYTDSNGNVFKIVFPFSLDGGPYPFEIMYNYGIALSLAQAVVQAVIQNKPV